MDFCFYFRGVRALLRLVARRSAAEGLIELEAELLRLLNPPLPLPPTPGSPFPPGPAAETGGITLIMKLRKRWRSSCSSSSDGRLRSPDKDEDDNDDENDDDDDNKEDDAK